MPININERPVSVRPGVNPLHSEVGSSTSLGSEAASTRLAEAEAAAFEARVPHAPGPLNLPGVYSALVVSNRDPERLGRVSVSFPWLAADARKTLTVWARMTQFLAGGKRGAWFLPEVNDEVLVAFEAGDPERPYVLGSLWNGVDRPPVSDAELSDNNIKRLQTRSGVRITIDDRSGDERIVLSVPDGPKLELSARDGLTLEATSNNRIVISDQGIEITARQISATSNNDMTLSAGKDLELNAARDVDLHADGDCRVQADRDIALQGHDVTIAETG